MIDTRRRNGTKRFLPRACPDCNGVVDLLTGECARCGVYLPGAARRDIRYRWIEEGWFEAQVTLQEKVARESLLRAVYPVGTPPAHGNIIFMLERAAAGMPR